MKPMGFWWGFFKGGSTQNRWALMGDFSKGGVHKTDGLWWMIFKGGSTQNRWGWMSFGNFLLLQKLSVWGVYFGKYRILSYNFAILQVYIPFELQRLIQNSVAGWNFLIFFHPVNFSPWSHDQFIFLELPQQQYRRQNLRFESIVTANLFWNSVLGGISKCETIFLQKRIFL